MMMIGPLIMGTTAASGGSGFEGFIDTPNPLYVDGAWWSFGSSKSQKSTDNGVTWVDDNDQLGAIPSDTDFANGILAGVGGSFVNHKDLSALGNDWIATSVSSLPGGFIAGGINLLHSDDTNNVFILNKSEGRDLYTSTDLVTYTPVNGVVENDLRLNNRLRKAHWIVYTGSEYVAYGVKVLGTPDTYGTATSSDLLTWVAQTPTAPQFFDIRYFNGIYVGVAVPESGLQVWHSADFINWTQSTLPSLEAGALYNQVAVQDGRYHLLSHTQIFESTDGITFTTLTAKFNFYKFTTFIKSKGPRLATFTPPDRLLMTSGDIDQLGGKIINWTGSLDATPLLTYPTSAPSGAVVGFTGQSSISGSGIGAQGFSVVDTTTQGAFYLQKTGFRYFEYTILSHSGTLDAQIGVDVPSELFVAVPGTFSVVLSSFGAVITNSGSLPVDYSMVVGQVIGFTVNFITSEIEIFIDGVSLVVIPNIANTALWTQTLECFNAEVALNVGQDSFAHQPGGTLAWADEYT